MNRSSSAPDRSGLFWGLAVLSGGVVALFGYYVPIPPAESVGARFGTAFNTALGFALGGGAILALALGRRPAVVRLLAWPMGLLGLLSLIQAITGLDLRVDQLLRQVPEELGVFTPGRVAPITALLFVVAAVALDTIATRPPATAQTLVGLLGGAAMVFIAGLDLLGRVLQLPLDNPFPNSPQLPPFSAALAILLGSGIAVASGWRAPARLTVLRPALAAGFLAVLTGTILAHLARAQERGQARRTVAAVATGTAVAVDMAVREMYEVVIAAAEAAAAAPEIGEARWREIVTATLGRAGGGVALAFRPDPDGVPWRVAHQPNALPPDTLTWLAPPVQARVRSMPDIRGRWPMPLVVESVVRRGDTPVGTVRLQWDVWTALGDLITALDIGAYAVDVRFGGASLFRNPAAERAPLAGWTEERALMGLDAVVSLRLWPTAEALAEARTGLPILTQTVTCAIAVLIALGLHFLGAARRRTAELEAAQEALESSQLRLREVERLETVGRLAAGVAHEFNNLLTSIRGYAGLAAEALPADSPVQNDLGEVQAAAQRATELTGQLLAVGQRQLLLPERAILRALVVRGVERFHGQLPADVQIRYASDLPDEMVYVDPGRFEELLGHVLRNAVEAMPQGGEITIASGIHQGPLAERDARPARPDGRYLWIEVTDTGRGMEPASVSRLLEPFGSPTTRGGRVGGLGLPAVFGVVAQSGGALAIRSAPGRGTSVRVYLPVVAGQVGEEPPAPAPPPPATPPAVLLVEDEAAIRQLAARMLQAHGYEVHAAADATAALDLLTAMPRPPALLISDVLMPGMNGDELAARIRERVPDVALLFISGFAADHLTAQGIALRGAAFLQKPFVMDELLAQVQRLAPSTEGEVPAALP